GGPPARIRRLVDHHFRPVGVRDVAMLLAAEGVWLEEADLMPVPGERAQDSPVIGRSAVPVGRDQRGSEEGDLHRATSIGRVIWGPEFMASMNSKSSSTRWAQLWRAAIAARPLSLRLAASSGSFMR